MKRYTHFLMVAAMAVVWVGCNTDQSPTSTVPGGSIQPAAKPATTGLDRAMEVQDRNTARLLALDGVVGTASGLDQNGDPTVKVFTVRPGVGGIPESLDGIPVSVEVTGMFVARQDPTARFARPVPIGVSTGHPDITAGTIGARVKDASGSVFALSNNHVYANGNKARTGDNVLQPGSFDGGQDPADAIGTLHDFEPIQFNGPNNTIDAAIARSSIGELGYATPSNGYGTPGTTTTNAWVGMLV